MPTAGISSTFDTTSFQKKKKRQKEKELDPEAKTCEAAFEKVVNTIKERVLKDEEIILMSELRNIYIQVLEDEGYPNKNFRREKLKAKLTKHDIHSKIRFAKVSPGNKGFISYLVPALQLKTPLHGHTNQVPDKIAMKIWRMSYEKKSCRSLRSQKKCHGQ